ncbi:hypothetical protein HAX54_032990 [Datura stramonium]|uniref:Nucleotidyl transferase domain-containing protein n=1 Tax=Datura stramonium TaxID=4076 RepID=A0ABS8SDC1_DATST|nr:hypothetical protein [Datura stramonium]
MFTLQSISKDSDVFCDMAPVQLCSPESSHCSNIFWQWCDPLEMVVEVLAATQTPGNRKKMVQGTADAVRQFIWVFELFDSRASDFGLVKIDSRGRVVQFAEKPKGFDLKAMQVDTTLIGLSPQDAKRSPYIASMGVYVFKTDVLLKLLKWRYPTANDFVEIIPAAIAEHNVKHVTRDYWEDIGTVKSLFMMLTWSSQQEHVANSLYVTFPKFQFYDPETPFYTSPGSFLAKIDNCKIKDAIISWMFLVNNAKIGKDVVIMNKDGVQEADRPEEGFYISQNHYSRKPDERWNGHMNL